MKTLAVFVICAGVMLMQGTAYAHCDTLDGPVVKDAKTSLEKGEMTPVLKWVTKENGAEIRSAFDKTLVVRKQGKDAQELADMYFFETLVRIHRAGEGAPYTGLKPAGTDPGPAVSGADKALDTGSIDALVKLVTDHIAAGIHERFEKASEAKKHMNESVEAGRKYVEAYVEFVHYVERLHLDAAGSAHHEAEAETAPVEHEH